MAAAYAALVSLSRILNQILHPPPTHRFLIPTEQIQSLLEQVSSFVGFLDKYSKSEEFTEDLEKRIVGAAHKAEDIIESYVVTQIQERYKVHPQRKSSAPFLRSIQKEIRELLPIHRGLKKKAVVKVISKFTSIRKDLDEIRGRKGMEDVKTEDFKEASSSRSLPGGKNFMIGFDEHLMQIKTTLVTYESGLQIIPVVGMGGIGKTTLATDVYNDAYIVEYFDVRAWVSISQEYMERDIIMALLQQIYSNIEANKLSADKLGNLLHKQLFGRRYFIVLDDMWDSQAWELLKLFLPDNHNGSRILVTTRLLNLAKGFESCEPYQINLLNDDCSWALILEQVFGKKAYPSELEDIGKSIARKCGGLPLALVVIGGLLAKSGKTKKFWEYVEENVTSTANDENDEQCMKILRLSYSQLQVYLQPCFLYLAVFPKNVEIRVSRLIKLWVAEGFIKPASGKTLEEVAEGYLNDLLDRNLVMVSKRGLTGKVKICSIHDLVRDLITREVRKNKFLCLAMLDNFSPHMKSERRLSIHIGTTQDKTCEVLRSSTLNRSFLSCSKWKSRRCLDRSLNLLRILDVVDFYSMEEILRLFNSRYITCDTPRESQALSSLISLLWNLQTLVVPGSLSLPSEIWQMPQLRHLKMPGITLPDPQGESDSIIVLENLQTLSTVKDFIFREQVLERIPNLKKLGIRCDAIEKLGFFCLSNLASLRKLESLVLAFRGTWENMTFSKSLKKLSLSYCQIPWEDMHVVGSLPNLEVLQLQSRAARGRTWNLNADEFCRLKFLLIEQCEMETWVADDGYFPCLEHLHLVSMKMKEIPMKFAEIPTLQTIDLNYCSRSLFASAKKISKEREDFGYEEIQVRSFPSEAPNVGETNVVGFEDEAENLIGYLSEESEELEVIAIVGMPGLGKTTLVGKIFQDPEIQYEFPTRMWVHVSQEFTKKDIFLAILKNFTRITEDIKSKTDEELADLVVGYLDSGRFLLVMDDVWSCEDWDKLKIALPNTNSRGKVLVTSRQTELGWHVNRRKGPHMLRFLTPEESILLLQLEVFREPKFPIDLEVEGRLIAERCGGLPLAIVVIRGILVKKFSSDITAMKSTWNNVSESFDTYLKAEDKGKRMDKIILLSYENLPHHLRECFLYFGMFPEEFEIPAWKLIRLWIAEGFIQQKNDVSLEETAENYLEELINRNLVRAEKFKVGGKVKTCRVHALLRDFCLTEAGIKGEGFLEEIKMSSHGSFQPPISEELKFRRLCIHSNALNFISRKPYGPSVHSFVCFSGDEMLMPVADISSLPGGFKLLGVLDVEPIKFTKLPSDMYQLVYLRYLVLSINLRVLPSGFSKLWNIQTLVVVTDSRTLDIKADILNMIELRHFKTNALATLPKTSKSSKGAGEKIQTLGTISPESCTEDVFERTPNLKKLGVRGKLAVLLDEKTGSFDSLGYLGNLEELKLLNDVFPFPPSGFHLRGLPPAYKFPPKLKILTLSQTSLDWCHMSIIGSLEKLEVLKLKDNAFMGETWKATDGGFRHLEVLIIGRTNLKVWEASDHHFPRLKHLELNNCEDLQQVPIELADVLSFLKLGLFRSRRAAASAKKIKEKIKENDHKSGTDVRPFTLSIWPPEE